MIKAINHNVFPKKINIDRCAANRAAIEAFNSDNDTTIEVRQVKFLNNVVVQNYRSIKGVTNSRLGLKSLESVSRTLHGIEIVHAFLRGQLAMRASRKVLLFGSIIELEKGEIMFGGKFGTEPKILQDYHGKNTNTDSIRKPIF